MEINTKVDTCQISANTTNRVVCVQGHAIVLENRPDVFCPESPSLFLAENFRIQRGESVCDMGTGCGLYAIVAAKLGARISYGIDISNTCIRLARRNAHLNKTRRVCRFIQSDFFSRIAEKKFNGIISNPPQTPRKYLSTKPQVNNATKNIRIALDGGENGVEVAIEMIRQCHSHLVEKGRLYVLILKWNFWEDIVIEMKKHFSRIDEIISKSISYSSLSSSFLESIVPQFHNKYSKKVKDKLGIAVYEAIK